MLNDYLQIYNLSIVIAGEFNPIITQPFWLSSKKLIREQEAQNAKVEIMHPEVVKFSLDWVKVEATRDRIELKTTQEPYFEPLRDLAVSMFSVLSETPLKAVGLNHLRYFALNDKQRYYDFGNKLAPLANFNEVLNDPRLFGLDILEQKRKDQLAGTYRVRIQPSDIKLSTEHGILININDNMTISPGETGRSGEIVKLISTHWENSKNRAFNVCEEIWNKVNV